MRFLLTSHLRCADAQKNLRKATINDASLCDDPNQAAGTLEFEVQLAEDGSGRSRFGPEIAFKVCEVLLLMPHSGSG